MVSYSKSNWNIEISPLGGRYKEVLDKEATLFMVKIPERQKSPLNS